IFIHLRVAVVVDAVADLRGAWKDGRASVVTVARLTDPPVHRSTGELGDRRVPVAIAVEIPVQGSIEPLVDESVAVLVVRIAGLDRAGMGRRLDIVAVE